MSKVVLLLTGTVNTSGVPFVQRMDRNLRLNDYKRTIKKWLSCFDGNIIFVENSNLSKIEIGSEIISNDRFEFLVFDGQNFPRHLGKGFGEFEAIEYALRNSKYIGDSDLIVKCTGRYFFKHINRFTASLNFDVIGNFNSRLDYMDSRVFAFKRHFFLSDFAIHKSDINDSNGVFFEMVLSKAVHTAIGNGKRWSSIPFPLIVSGISGTDNYQYNSLKSSLKIAVKFYMSKLL